MQGRLIVIVLAIVVCLAIGWAGPPSSDPPAAAISSLRLRTFALTEPGRQAPYAAAYLARLNPPPPPLRPPGPPPTPRPPPAPPPPPPDVADVLRAAITAVLQEPRGGLALVLAGGAGATGRRVLHTGDTFEDGWRIVSIGRRQAVLQRRDEQRAVNFYDAAAGA